ncbi:hypothetical protein ARMSODRAFT_963188 [Armillaria solidipes]|uniref:Uncharacterized protein n=1 Tax=Armillaria solidipes TaxID=1076256 RepID=A0A2H3B333_9AGAR|nr:hypothetical protein ARMSODRAFT_963188 [Armillaria solidipes]
MLDNQKFILLRPSYATFAQARMGARFRSSGYPVVALLCHQTSKHSILLLTLIPSHTFADSSACERCKERYYSLRMDRYARRPTCLYRRSLSPHVSIEARLLETASIGVDTTADTGSPKVLVARKSDSSCRCVSKYGGHCTRNLCISLLFGS